MTAAEGFRVEYRAVPHDPAIHARLITQREDGDAVVGVLTMAADEWLAFVVVCKAQGIPVRQAQEPANGGDDRPSRGGAAQR